MLQYRLKYETVRTQMPFRKIVFYSTFSLFSLFSLSLTHVLSLFLLQITSLTLKTTVWRPHWSSCQSQITLPHRFIVLRTPSFNGTAASPINGMHRFTSLSGILIVDLATPISGLWVCVRGCGFVPVVGLGCGFVWFGKCGFLPISLVVFLFLFFFFWGGVGGCEFVPMVAVGVVAAVVVGGRCCGMGVVPLLLTMRMRMIGSN